MHIFDKILDSGTYNSVIFFTLNWIIVEFPDFIVIRLSSVLDPGFHGSGGTMNF